jgi:hypothetical protein
MEEAFMKKLVILSLAVVCVAALIPQNLDAGVGIKAGYSLSKFKVESAYDLPFEWGNLPYYVGGLYFNVNLGFVSIQPEILYTRMGGRWEADASNSLEYWFDYVQVPVLLKLNVIPAGPIRPFIYGGGYGAYLLKATGVMVVDGTELPRTDIKDTYQELDYGVIGGVGLTFKLPGIALTIEGRYNYGLRNLYIDPAEGESMKNTSMVALIGIGF